MRATLIRTVAVALAAAVLVPLAACASQPAAHPVITVSLPPASTPVLPWLANDPTARALSSALNAGLVSYGADGTPANELAASITTTDSVHYTVALKAGLGFSDGSPITAQTVVDSWQYAALPSHDAVGRSAFAPIQGYAADPSATDTDTAATGTATTGSAGGNKPTGGKGKKPPSGDLVADGGLTVVDDQTFTVTLSAAESDFVMRLGLPAFEVVPPAALADPTGFAQHPFGAGPYRISKAPGADGAVRLERNPAYAGPRIPKSPAIDIRYDVHPEAGYADLLTGGVDVALSRPSSLASSTDPALTALTTGSPKAVEYVLAIPEGIRHWAGAEGVSRRNAISRALDRSALATAWGSTSIAAVGFGSPVAEGSEPFAMGSEAVFADNTSPGNLWTAGDKSDRWMTSDEAFTIDYSDDAERPVLDAMAQQINDGLGITVTLQKVPDRATWLKQLSDPDHPVAAAYFLTLSPEYPGSGAVVGDLMQISETDLHYANKKADKLLLKAQTEKSFDKAQADYQQLQVMLAADLPVIPLLNGRGVVEASSQVHGAALDWQGVLKLWTLSAS